MFWGRFFEGGLIEFTSMFLISLLLGSIFTDEGCVGKVFVWKSSISYREHQSSRLSHASVLLKENCLEFFLCHFTVSEVVRPIF